MTPIRAFWLAGIFLTLWLGQNSIPCLVIANVMTFAMIGYDTQRKT